MAEQWFELKLATGKRARWKGADGIDAARRYVDVHRDAAVVAWRYDRRPQIRIGIPEEVDRGA